MSNEPEEDYKPILGTHMLTGEPRISYDLGITWYPVDPLNLALTGQSEILEEMLERTGIKDVLREPEITKPREGKLVTWSGRGSVFDG